MLVWKYIVSFSVYRISGMDLSSSLLMVCLLLNGLIRNIFSLVSGFLFSVRNSSVLRNKVVMMVIIGDR